MIGSVWPGSSDAHYQFDLRRSDVLRVSISRNSQQLWRRLQSSLHWVNWETKMMSFAHNWILGNDHQGQLTSSNWPSLLTQVDPNQAIKQRLPLLGYFSQESSMSEVTLGFNTVQTAQPLPTPAGHILSMIPTSLNNRGEELAGGWHTYHV